MKKILKQLEKGQELLQDKFDIMDEKFHGRSDTWQESDKGVEFEDKMAAIETAIDDMQCIIDELETEFNFN